MTEGISEGIPIMDTGAENLASKDIAPNRSFENTRKLFQDAMAQGLFNRLFNDLSPRRTQQLEEKVEIAKEYVLGNSTLEEVGKGYGLLREGVRAKVEDVINRLYNAGDDRFKKDHPLTEISYGKPRYSQKSAEKRSETVGGPSAKIKNAMKDLGISEVTPDNIDEIAEYAGITRAQVQLTRPSLKNWGINIPEVKPHIFKDFAEKIEKENDYQKLQGILDSYFPSDKPNARRRYVEHHRKDGRKVLTDLSSIVRDAGFHFAAKLLGLFAEKVRGKHFPIIIRSAELETEKGKIVQTYYVVPAKCAEAIKEALRNDPELQGFRKNPVKLVCGTFEGEIPNTTDLMKNPEGKYASNLALLAREINGFVTNSAKPDWNLSTLMKDCPVPVFRANKKYYYPADRLEEIKAYLKTKQPVL